MKISIIGVFWCVFIFAVWSGIFVLALGPLGYLVSSAMTLLSISPYGNDGWLFEEIDHAKEFNAYRILSDFHKGDEQYLDLD